MPFSSGFVPAAMADVHVGLRGSQCSDPGTYELLSPHLLQMNLKQNERTARDV